jgi:serine/threonine protein kinase
MTDIIKTGSFSILLGINEYKGFIPEKENKLVKITKFMDSHNELTHLDIVRSISNYSVYYAIPDEVINILEPTHKFYQYLKNKLWNRKIRNLDIFDGRLSYFYIDNAGNKDLQESMEDIIVKRDYSIWKSNKIILIFTKKIMAGVAFLHKKKLCHLDIKPENIIVNTLKCDFKIIDFGFCSLYPFDDYVNHLKGTQGYFPKAYNNRKIEPWLPKIYANDMILVNNKLPIKENRQLIYKIDSFCFGRVLYLVKYIFDDNKHRVSLNNSKSIKCCFNTNSNKHNNKLNNIMGTLLENNIYKRLTIQQCINKYKL